MKLIQQKQIVVLIMFCLLLVPNQVFAKSPPENGKYVERYPGKKQPSRITWRKEGQLVRKKLFFKNGKLQQDVVYRDGEKILERRYYYSGRLKSFWSEKAHEFRLYDKDGKLKRKVPTTAKGLTQKNRPRSLIYGR